MSDHFPLLVVDKLSVHGSTKLVLESGQAWSPRNAYVDSEGLHLTVKKDDLGAWVWNGWLLRSLRYTTQIK
ncbi:MAG: hypothetical protein R2942_03620 [Ignavibacteria bacterium]